MSDHFFLSQIVPPLNFLQPLKFVKTTRLRSVYASVHWGKKFPNCVKHELKKVTAVYSVHGKGALCQIIFDM
jgi:hypothetical protein